MEYAFVISPIRAICLAHLILLNLNTRIIFGNDCKLWCSFLLPPCYFYPLWFKYSSQHPVLKHTDLCCFLNTRHQVSHPYKTNDVYFNTCVLVSRRKDKIFWTEWCQAVPDFNPLKPKLFNNSVRTAKKTQHFTITKINWLTLFKEIIAVYSEKHTKPINTKCSVTGC
jgi:hypothetical protein